MALRIFKRLRELLDVDTTGVADGDALTYDAGTETWVPGAGGGGGGAPTDVNYLVGTASGDLSAEIVVGTSPGGELGGTWASPTVDATHSGSSHASVQSAAEATAAAALASHEADTTSVHGITNTAALLTTTAGDAAYQPKDSDLTAIAALTTTSFGRGLLELANQAALLSAAGAAAASHVHAGEDITSGTVADARIASTIARDSEVTSAIAALSTVYQPLDSDLTAIAALTTTAFGRGLLDDADAAAARTTIGVVIGTDVEAHDADLTTIAGLSPSNDDVLQRKAGAWANRTIAQLLTDLAAPGTTFQPLDSDLTAFAGLSIAADKLPYGTGSHTLGLADLTSFARTFLDDADAATVRATLGVIASCAYLRDEKSTNTHGGTATTGSWQTRVLNTEVYDPDGIVSLASNVFTLGAGTYEISATGPFWQTGRTRIRIRNTSDSTTVSLSPSSYVTAVAQSFSIPVKGYVTIAGSKNFELQYRCDTTVSDRDLGVESNFSGEIEIYGEVFIRKMA